MRGVTLLSCVRDVSSFSLQAPRHLSSSAMRYGALCKREVRVKERIRGREGREGREEGRKGREEGREGRKGGRGKERREGGEEGSVKKK